MSQAKTAAGTPINMNGQPMESTTRKPMRKYQACGALCEIRRDIEGHLEWAKKDQLKDQDTADLKRTPENQESLNRYRAEEIAKYQRWIAALEIAGDALTK